MKKIHRINTFIKIVLKKEILQQNKQNKLNSFAN